MGGGENHRINLFHDESVILLQLYSIELYIYYIHGIFSTRHKVFVSNFPA